MWIDSIKSGCAVAWAFDGIEHLASPASVAPFNPFDVPAAPQGPDAPGTSGGASIANRAAAGGQSLRAMVLSTATPHACESDGSREGATTLACKQLASRYRSACLNHRSAGSAHASVTAAPLRSNARCPSTRTTPWTMSGGAWTRVIHRSSEGADHRFGRLKQSAHPL
ncbi:hypothetical protein C0Z19_18025 [Trinickia soli]|uniref:Uncharacterized protein n=1 Tax=Trinickia soli TaxID=380675 RepID=A0A2N7VXI2_9BURK|nr:hypothetical protein C0Z19_18025 [Trinickia soli]